MEHKDSIFNQLPKDQLREMIIELETEIYTRHSDVDHFYRKKVTDTCENLKLLLSYRDVAE